MSAYHEVDPPRSDARSEIRAGEPPARAPTITAVVGAYNAREWIGETVAAILAQTRPPEEVIVVDDGSTDGTARELRRFGDAIRVVGQANGGCPAAFNRAFAEARGDYIAMCGADDVWEPAKLEYQAAALAAHPEIDIALGGARVFGSDESFDGFRAPTATGLLDCRRQLRSLYRANNLCASSALIRRELYRRLGPFVEHAGGERFACDDYDYWLRALATDAVLYYDPRVLVGYRRHEGNATNDKRWMYRSQYRMHRWHAGEVDDPRLVRAVLASDLFSIARGEVDARERRRARAMFLASLRQRVTLHALAFVLVLALPERQTWGAVDGLVALRRSLAQTTVPAPGVDRA